MFLIQSTEGVTCGTGCVQNYTHYINSGTSWSGAWFSRTDTFCGRSTVDWLSQAATAQASNLPVNDFLIANYLLTALNVEVGSACSAIGVRVSSAGMKINYMTATGVMNGSPLAAVCNGSADNWNAYVISQKPLYKTTFYNYVSGTDGGPVLCSPPPL